MTYGDEQAALETEIAEIQSVADRYESDSERASKFMKLVERYTGFDEITPAMIREFVDKIVVHEKDERYVQTSPQRVEIHFNFVGEVEFLENAHEPTPEEIAEQERAAKEHEYNRSRYLKRKAAGYYNKSNSCKNKKDKSA